MLRQWMGRLAKRKPGGDVQWQRRVERLLKECEELEQRMLRAVER